MRIAPLAAALLCALATGAPLRALAAGARAEQEAPLAPEDFAFGRDIEIDRPGPLQTLMLDLDVYQGSVAPALADLRVMNAAGEPVPHAVRPLRGPTPRERGELPLPLFALDAGDEGDAPGSWRIRAEVSEGGALVAVDARPPLAGAPGDAPPPTAYLVDASQLEAPVRALELELAPGATGFVVPVRVEGSDDLARFEPVGGRSVVARLEQGGHRIERNEVGVAGSRHRYLRLRFPGARLPVHVTGVRARLGDESVEPARERSEFTGTPVADEPGHFLFDLGGALPLDRAQILLPRSNTLVQARLRSSALADGPWLLRYEGLVYALEYGETLRNPELDWPLERDRWLRLELTPAGALGQDAPRLEARWHPEQLLFVTQGPAPYRLVYGRHAARPAPFHADEILAARRSPDEAVPRATARLGPEAPLGDRSVLEPAPPPPPYRTWALWAVLIVAVATVAGLTASLLRQMRAAGRD